MARQGDCGGFSTDLAGPLIVGTVEARRGSVAGAPSLAAAHESFE